MSKLEHQHIQGFVARGYKDLPEAVYLLCHIDVPAEARIWLGTLLDLITPSSDKGKGVAHHIAFTHPGLKNIGMQSDDLRTFPHAFQEGMEATRRTRILGDDGESAPGNWRWGTDRGDDSIHLLLLIFAVDAQTLENAINKVRNAYRGITEKYRLDTLTFIPAREHFGFGDGISQPIINGLSRTGAKENTLPPGEFILGYENAHGKIPITPTVTSAHDPTGILPRTRIDVEALDGGNDLKTTVEAADFGRNGSYLVFRQLSQDVKGFWGFINRAAEETYGEQSRAQRMRIAAKMVGRWPSGAPLTVCPAADDPAHARRDDFSYAADPHGNLCPVGAHIRRANPRDALEGTREESIKKSNLHRLLRRGRPYGAPLSQTFDVDEILAARSEGEEVGLHFICLNADLERQFEFVQQTWINNPKFGNLYSDVDPLLGGQGSVQGTFTLQREPLRERINGVNRFVEVRGGGYFFLPSLPALRYLTSLSPAKA